MLAGVEIKGRRRMLSVDESLSELAQLADAAGALVVATVRQRLDRPSRSYMGTGKLHEIQALTRSLSADVVIVDDELTPAQQRIVEHEVGVKVIDRAALIIDIFARRARSKEGRVQVELAQHEYLLPRLAGQWSHLERLGGGIGTRGPGETQIETDRRLIRGRISRLKSQIESVRTHRALYRERRKRHGAPVVALIGYTNAGKSTLFNALGRAQTLVLGKLFATLDPVTRRARLPSGKTYLLTDTVGFIHKLPHALVDAFHATLEELAEADVLLHVVDITHPNAATHAQVVQDTLRKMGLGRKPMIMALNKIDAAVPDARGEEEMLRVADPLMANLGAPEGPTAIISAAKGWGLDVLRGLIDDELSRVSTPAGVIEIG